MGMPNFKRLAELGQLPEYAKEIESLVEVNEKNKAKKEEVKEDIKVENDLMQLKGRELRDKCEELGLDAKGNKAELVARIEEALKEKEEVKVEEVKSDGEFVDDLLK